MLTFVTGFLVPFLALYGWGLKEAPPWIQRDAQSQQVFFLVTVLVPLACAWAGAELVNLTSPRRLLHRHFRRRFIVRAALGAIAGTTAAVAAAGLLPLVDRFVHDGVVTGTAAAVASLAATFFLSRVRGGHCIHCQYDLRSSPGPGRYGAAVCPECGTPALA
jgi:uncharacterized membrane protein YraQ (UPF0718 family)